MLEILRKKQDPEYFDIPPDDSKSPDELVILILQNAAGEINHIPTKYNRLEVDLCARQLIVDGYLRGTVFSQYECSWSRLTKKGMRYLDILKAKLKRL